MTNQNKTQNIEDNFPMVNYIMLHRCYDMLTLIASLLSKDETEKNQVSNMVKYHEDGYLLGPLPSYKVDE